MTTAPDQRWYFHVVVDVCATDRQAEQIADRIGSVLVDRAAGHTELSTYVSASHASRALAIGGGHITDAMKAADLSGTVVELELKTEQRREAQLRFELGAGAGADAFR
jgi:hypothetical protein